MHPEGEDDQLWYLRAELDVPVYSAAGYTRDTGETSMGSYSRMRLLARLARRTGLQPTMVINRNDQLP